MRGWEVTMMEIDFFCVRCWCVKTASALFMLSDVDAIKLSVQIPYRRGNWEMGPISPAQREWFQRDLHVQPLSTLSIDTRETPLEN